MNSGKNSVLGLDLNIPDIKTPGKGMIPKYIQTLKLLQHTVDHIKTSTALEECVTQLMVDMLQPIILQPHLQHLGQHLGPKPFQLCWCTWQEHPAQLSRNVLSHHS